MKILAFDHFFYQDLDCLEAVADEDTTVTRIPYQRWRRLAQSCFPRQAFDGISAAYASSLQSNWKKFDKIVDREVAWLCRVYSPNVFVLPSDSFFYIRPFIEKFRLRGVPTFVMQKETTISPLVMDQHSLQIRQWVPFMSDYMTVCSERHKEFWIRAGANSELIEVTGQPRFDIYATNFEATQGSPKRLLFLSYDDVAYLPTDVGQDFDGTWEVLRKETEAVLNRASEDWLITVKEHPQQARAESVLASCIVRADRFVDTRYLLKQTDVVVAFQTTAVYEAIVCRRPVIYAAWGSVFDAVKDSLNRFETIPGMVTWASSPAELSELLSREVAAIPLSSEEGLSESISHLGPIDGSASIRTLQLIRLHAGQSSEGEVSLSPLLRALRNTCFIPVLYLARSAAHLVRPGLAARFDRKLRTCSTFFYELKSLMQIGGANRDKR